MDVAPVDSPTAVKLPPVSPEVLRERAEKAKERAQRDIEKAKEKSEKAVYSVLCQIILYHIRIHVFCQ